MIRDGKRETLKRFHYITKQVIVLMQYENQNLTIQQLCISKEAAGDYVAGILGSEMKCPFRVYEGVKMTSARYVEFITDHFLL